MLSILVFLLACGLHCSLADKACPYKPLDVVFMLDASGSEGINSFQKQLNFVANYTSQFEIGPNNTQVSVVTFGTIGHIEFTLNKYQNKSDVLEAINRTKYWNGETNTHLALSLVRYNVLTQTHGARPNVTKMVILLTDGHSLEPIPTINGAQALKKNPTVTFVTIGIGNHVDYNELRQMASDSNHTFSVTDFDALHSISEELLDVTCSVCRDDQADILFVLDSSGSEGAGNFMKQLEFVNLITHDLTIGTQATQLGVITFATGGWIEIPLNRYSDKSALMQNVLKIPYRNGETYTDVGLILAASSFSRNRNGARFGANKYCIVLTDGHSTEETRTVKAANNLHRTGTETFAVGIGGHVDPAELDAIATDHDHVYRVDHFDQLDTIHKTIINAICTQKNELRTTTPKPTTLPTTTRPTTPTTTLPTTPTTTTKPECGQKPADILFLLDASDSEGADNFQTQLEFVHRFASQFAIGPKNVLFSLATFSTDVVNQFYFNTHHGRHDVLDAIDKTPYAGLGTNTSEALKFAREESFKATHGARANATRVVIVITDGRSSDPTVTASEANLLHKTATVFSIGIGPAVDQAELQTIASNRHNVVQVDSFKLLHTIEKQLTDSACA